MRELLPDSWRPWIGDALGESEWAGLAEFVARERSESEVYPQANQVFAALRATAPSQVRVVLLGQDPYHGPGQAHGLSFSVPRGVKPPPSLVNIFKELESDVGVKRPAHGCLERWASQGVLLLNTVLTVRAGAAHSHRRQGWEQLTDAVIRHLAGRPQPIVFLLWGGPAQKKSALIGEPHCVLKSPHPSPLSAHQGFLGSRPFSQANQFLADSRRGEIDWRL